MDVIHQINTLSDLQNIVHFALNCDETDTLFAKSHINMKLNDSYIILLKN